IVIWWLPRPAFRAIAHSPRETTFAPRPAAPKRRTTPATSFALTEYWRIHGSGKAAASSLAAASTAAWSVTWTGVPTRRAAARSASAIAGSGSAGSVVDEEPDDRADDAEHDRADQRPDESIEGEVGREAVDREMDVHLVGQPGDQQQHRRIDHEGEQAKGGQPDRQRQQLDDRLDQTVDHACDHRQQDQAGDVALVLDVRLEQVGHGGERDRRHDRVDEEPSHASSPPPIPTVDDPMMAGRTVIDADWPRAGPGRPATRRRSRCTTPSDGR